MIWESFLDQFEILITTKGNVVDLIGEIEIESLHHQVHNNILVSMRRYMEISWDPIDLEIALDIASLLLFDFFFDTI